MLRTPSRASSSACPWRSWCRAKPRLSGEPSELGADRGARPRAPAGWAVDDAKQRPEGKFGPGAESGAQLLPAPLVYADLASPPSLAVPNQNRSAPRVKVVLGERERLLDAQPGTPQHDDHRAQPPAVTVIGGVAHHRDDLLHGRWVGRVAHPLVTRRAPGVVARHRRRRATPARGIQR